MEDAFVARQEDRRYSNELFERYVKGDELTTNELRAIIKNLLEKGYILIKVVCLVACMIWRKERHRRIVSDV